MENFNYNTSCFFTGHRIISNAERPNIISMTKNFCIELIKKYGVRHFISGAAMGYDTLAANVILDLKEHYPHIMLHLYLPCRDQAQRWKPVYKAEWDRLIMLADETKYIHDGNYFDGCMQLRNDAMVNDAYYGICFCRRNTGGTYATIKKALQKKRFICVLPTGEYFGALPE
ncbi:MAG: SLOG family protein [Candidatus Ornithomonoglobus sp.]